MEESRIIYVFAQLGIQPGIASLIFRSMGLEEWNWWQGRDIIIIVVVVIMGFGVGVLCGGGFDTSQCG
jgi:hypothetical protein